MIKFLRTTILALALLAASSAVAQVSHGGEPLFNHSMAKVTTNTHYLPTIDNAQLLQQDIDGVKGAGPMRVGIGQKCNIDVLADAQKTKDADGMHFMLAVQSPGATFVGLAFSAFELAEGAELFIYDQSGEFVLGKYVKSDVMDDGRFVTQAVPGSTAYIEYNVPAGTDPGKLQISSVRHGYKDIFQMIEDTYDEAEANMKGQHGNADGDCHINVKCPEGDDWRDQIRSVVAIEIIANTNYGQVPFMCSGALVNNTRQDRTPYVLSAFHCQDESAMLSDLREYYPNIQITGLDFIFYFLYETVSCNSTAGVGNKSVSGGDIVAKYSYSSGSDMLLLKLRSDVPDAYTPYYAGWDRNSVSSPQPGSCIHHPGGDFKKISIPRAISNSSYYPNFYRVSWYTGTQMKGVTEQGSSGSPLFNASKRIIGQLYAGSSYCDQPEGDDYYGKVSVSWEGGGLVTNQLKNWLDPDNTGVSTLDGINYKDEDPLAINTTLQNKPFTVYPNPSNGMVRFDIDFIGSADYKVFDLSGRCVKEGTTVLTSTVQSIDLRSLPKGSYTLSLKAGSRTYSTQVVVK